MLMQIMSDLICIYTVCKNNIVQSVKCLYYPMEKERVFSVLLAIERYLNNHTSSLFFLTL